MLNPDDLLTEWVAALQALPNLMAALDDDADAIQAYTENGTVFGRQTQNNVRLALLTMPPGSIMISWDGTVPGRLGNMAVFLHSFSLYIKAPTDPGGASYAQLWNLIVNDVPQNSTIKMLHTPIDPLCEPMDWRLPEIHREVVVISEAGDTFEYFKASVVLPESYLP